MCEEREKEISSMGKCKHQFSIPWQSCEDEFVKFMPIITTLAFTIIASASAVMILTTPEITL